MEETKRQRQIARLIEEELATIFQRENLNMIFGGMVSVSKINLSPDLLEAKVFLSFFKIDQPQEALQIFKTKTSEIRGKLGNALRHHLRRIPQLHFLVDDTLEHASKIETLLDQIKTNTPSEENKDI